MADKHGYQDNSHGHTQPSEGNLQLDKRPDVSQEILTKWQKIVDLLARTIGVPAGLIMRVHPDEIEVFASSNTDGNPYVVGAKENLNSGLYCETVMAQRSSLLVQNALEDPEWHDNPDIELDMISYLGFPLIWPDSKVFGTVCVLDSKSNAYSPKYIELVQQFSDIINDDLKLLTERVLREQLEQKLNEQNKLFKLAFDSSPDSIDLNRISDGLYIDVNKGFCDIMGYQYEEAVGKTSLELSIWVNVADRAKLIEELRRYGFVDNLETEFRRKDGTIIIGLMSARVLSYEGEELILSITRDITEDKRSEEDLRQSEQKYRLIAENARDLIYRIRLQPEMRFEYVSPSATAMVGYTPEDHYADPQLGFKLVHPDDMHLLSSVAERNPDEPLVMRWIRKDGSVIWTEQNNTPILNDEGEIIVIEGIARDITERIRSKEELRQQRDELNRFFTVALDLLCIADTDGHFIRLNKVWENILGYPIDELEGQRFLDFVHPDDLQPTLDAIAQLDRQEQVVSFINRYQTRDGDYRYLEWRSHPYGKFIYAAARDITERKKIEESLRESEEKYRLLIENSYQGIMIEQADPIRIVFASQSVHTILGYTPDEIIAMQEEQLLEMIYPDDREPYIQHFMDCIRNKGNRDELRLRIYHKNGELRYLNVHRVLIAYHGQPATQATFVDVTDRIEADRLKIQFQTEQANNKLTQRVISMLSHDLRTPLAVIASAGDMLSRYFDRLSDEKRQEKLDVIGRQIQFALDILEDTVHIARGNLSEQQFNPIKTNLAMLCRISVDEIQDTQHDNHVIHFTNLSDIETVYIDEVLVSRILLNLLSNAIKYSPEGGEIRLELDQHNDWIVMRVIDEGTGIKESDLPHIFDLFYRSDEVNEINGTGLGLSIVKDCVDRLQGSIHVESSPGQGSTFTVELPIQRKLDQQNRKAV